MTKPTWLNTLNYDGDKPWLSLYDLMIGARSVGYQYFVWKDLDEVRVYTSVLDTKRGPMVQPTEWSSTDVHNFTLEALR